MGVHYAFEDFEQTTLNIMSNENLYKIFSFEIKKELLLSNLKEFFFQAVSNSSWANEGYLVAFNVEKDGDLMREAGRLCNSFGIGIISLTSPPEQSEILFFAREREKLDWDTIDCLVEANKDFSSFIDGIKKDIDNKEARSKFDDVLTDEEKMMEYLKAHNIFI